MSVKELVLTSDCGNTLIVVWNEESLKLKDSLLDGEGWELDRSEANLLMLYLQEHLGA